jgi:hypothetical protein
LATPAESNLPHLVNVTSRMTLREWMLIAGLASMSAVVYESPRPSQLPSGSTT